MTGLFLGWSWAIHLALKNVQVNVLKTSYCFVMEMFKKAYGARQKQIKKLSLWDDSWSLPSYSNWKKNVSWIDWKCSKALEIWDVRLFDGSYHFSNTGTGNGYMFSKLEYGLSLCAKKSWQIKPMLVSRLVVSVAQTYGKGKVVLKKKRSNWIIQLTVSYT